MATIYDSWRGAVIQIRLVRHVCIDSVASRDWIESRALTLGLRVGRPTAPLGLSGIEDVVVAQHRKMTLLGFASVGFSFTAEPFPEDDRRRMLAFADMSAQALSLFVTEPVRRGVRLARENEDVD